MLNTNECSAEWLELYLHSEVRLNDVVNIKLSPSFFMAQKCACCQTKRTNIFLTASNCCSGIN
jgi:hypothetical protein